MEHVSKIGWQSLLGKNLNEAKKTLTEILFAHFILDFLTDHIIHLLNDICKHFLREPYQISFRHNWIYVVSMKMWGRKLT